MTPEELARYLEVLKGSGMAFARVEIPGKLVLDNVGPATAARSVPDDSLARDLAEIVRERFTTRG